MRATAPEEPQRAPAKPIVRRSRLPLLALWIIPVAALVAAGFYFHAYLMDHGPLITVTFADASGLNSGQTPIEHRGVPIGQVQSISLTDDHKLAQVQIQLRRGQEAFACQGAEFWVVRPQISAASISGLSTVVSGPYIETTPGNGAAATEFSGLDAPPANRGPGLSLIAYAPRLEHLQADSAIYYRGIQVGVVENIELAQDATGVLVHMFIWRRYSDLARSTSRFWLVSGADVKGGILTGVEMKIDSIRSLISGGIAFATQDSKTGTAAKEGDQFPLYDEPQPEWLKWSTPIPIGSLRPGESLSQSDQSTGQQQNAATIKVNQ